MGSKIFKYILYIKFKKFNFPENLDFLHRQIFFLYINYLYIKLEIYIPSRILNQFVLAIDTISNDPII